MILRAASHDALTYRSATLSHRVRISYTHRAHSAGRSDSSITADGLPAPADASREGLAT
jgi:hypothetical protein